MVKRVFDLTLSSLGLFLLGPFLLCFMFIVWLSDFSNPLYIAPRVGKNGKIFRMIKIRSMVLHADRNGVETTGSLDTRITSVGRFYSTL